MSSSNASKVHSLSRVLWCAPRFSFRMEKHSPSCLESWLPKASASFPGNCPCRRKLPHPRLCPLSESIPSLITGWCGSYKESSSFFFDLGLPWKDSLALQLLAGLTEAAVATVLLINTVLFLPGPSHAASVHTGVLESTPQKITCFQSLRVCFLGNLNYKSSAI